MSGLSRRGFLAVSAAAGPVLAGGAASASPEAPRRHTVSTGADVLAAEGWRRLAGRRVGVVTNPTGVLHDLRHVVDAMHESGAVRVSAVFGPEHGFRGTAQAGGSEGDYQDPRTGIPVYDAYGVTADKLAEMFRKADVEVVVFDIADVGARFYTYIWTMYTAMRAAVATGAAFVVLDRPNPLGGQAFGPQLDPAFASGVGRKPIVQQHGMTTGELARLFDAEFLPADANGHRLSSLDVVAVRGWRRSARFAETGLRWVPPSPNMPTPDTALAYAGTCLFEGTSFSEGRGTTRPFETVGAPKVDWRWAEDLNALHLPGVAFRETFFVPTFGKHEKQTCGGVQLHITEAGDFDAIRTAVAMLVTARRRYPDLFSWRSDNWIDRLSGSDRLRRQVDAGAGVDEVVGAWNAELRAFRRQRERYLLYR
ncbi:Uncharacterized conserved protein YbbC, DUF1343 family [Streptoalloteichus tenebrarius]|uniref:Uncharacterized conserved protein YbbC, DUF1343 family n=1 Tax=Streptoalloteichus tenebrarius (strain ATCC 17920 / DSM 40477 / JCM 4838 / CBS 697.72 / NBRC 16177 / NCIMB 11028 / NRRL B-12390 / A12253. 1 / ISP 5477) TaxID=1933 RepID=A0ABT1HR32_STRSD|nr:DUF1343 domain-containing protein [Streptoalloteichus tenebrarius]MCP2257985.1 Uncharacterized conserved protein YbbC, DUF1343 family [Streptoalloteichus tenebrarius]BFF01652.1 DUF1343 domain-containing protein [Streptoalloteichus tenebrarius]